MRGLTNRDTLERFMRELGEASTAETRVYFTGRDAVLKDRNGP